MDCSVSTAAQSIDQQKGVRMGKESDKPLVIYGYLVQREVQAVFKGKETIDRNGRVVRQPDVPYTKRVWVGTIRLYPDVGWETALHSQLPNLEDGHYSLVTISNKGRSRDPKTEFLVEIKHEATGKRFYPQTKDAKGRWQKGAPIVF
jgi:hypothetical protein